MPERPCRVAVMDIGSQTFRMVGVECFARDARILFSCRENVRLGSGLGQDGILSAEAVQRGLDTIARFMAILDRHRVNKVRAVATAAMRRASNAALFLEQAARLGLHIEVIDWQEEAGLSVRGAALSVPGMQPVWAMVDVGGGSSEVVLYDGSRVVCSLSMEIGAVLLQEMLSSDKGQDAASLCGTARQFLQAKLSVLNPWRGQIQAAVATGGTATTAAAIALGLETYDPRKIRGFFISLPMLRNMLDGMLQMDLEQRRHVSGLEPGRADIFPAGIAILLEIINHLQLNGLFVSDSGLFVGLLVTFMEKECNIHVESSCARSLYF